MGEEIQIHYTAPSFLYFQENIVPNDRCVYIS